MKHILLIDPLDKLVVKKDSSLQLALTLKEMGKEVYLLFEDQFYFANKSSPTLKCFLFRGAFEEDSPYLSDFRLDGEMSVDLDEECVLHMRIDPPFDTRYLRYLWMLKALKTKHGVKVLNDPEGILIHNEKMVCYESEASVETYVGSSVSGLKSFLKDLAEKREGIQDDLIYKPLDLFQGIGVEKVSGELSEEEKIALFNAKKEEFKGPVVVQPFIKDVEKGEIRTIYFAGKELGSILKTPPEGEFLANIAQGATYDVVKLSDEVKEECMRYSRELMKVGVPWIAFDILGTNVQEANITCPGLLVEVSKAVGENLAIPLVEAMEEYLK